MTMRVKATGSKVGEWTWGSSGYTEWVCVAGPIAPFVSTTLTADVNGNDATGPAEPNWTLTTNTKGQKLVTTADGSYTWSKMNVDGSGKPTTYFHGVGGAVVIGDWILWNGVVYQATTGGTDTTDLFITGGAFDIAGSATVWEPRQLGFGTTGSYPWNAVNTSGIRLPNAIYANNDLICDPDTGSFYYATVTTPISTTAGNVGQVAPDYDPLTSTILQAFAANTAATIVDKYVTWTKYQGGAAWSVGVTTGGFTGVLHAVTGGTSGSALTFRPQDSNPNGTTYPVDGT